MSLSFRVPKVSGQRNCCREASGSEVARKERKRRATIPKHIKGRGEQQEIDKLGRPSTASPRREYSQEELPQFYLWSSARGVAYRRR